MILRLASAAAALVLSAAAASAVPGTPPSARLDPSFGDGGSTRVDAGGSEILRDLAVQADGSIIGVGTSSVGAESDGYVFRLRRDGRPDARFGARRLNVGPADRARAVAVLPDGRIVVAGDAHDTAYTVTVHRLLPNGDPDLSFSNDGRVVLDSDAGQQVSDVAVMPDGRIVVVGSVVFSGGTRATVHRLLPSGMPDNTLDGDGTVTLGITTADAATTVALQPDGKILVGGTAASNGLLILYRRNLDGSPDRSFGGLGYAAVPTGGESAGINDIALGSDGSIVLTGNLVRDNDRDALVARVTDGGAVDQTFGTAGVTRLDLGFDEDLTSVAATPDGGIITAGTVDADNVFAPLVARWTSTGAPDTSFTPKGWASYRRNVATSVSALVVQPDGKYLIAGDNGTGDLVLSRLVGSAAALRCGGRTATIVGTEGPDALQGTPGSDVIVGLGGADRIRGLGGNDVLCGGGGNDRLEGGAGQDRLIGGPGRDRTIQ